MRERLAYGGDRHDRHGLLRPVLIDNTGISMTDDPVPDYALMVPAASPTARMKRKFKRFVPRSSTFIP